MNVEPETPNPEPRTRQRVLLWLERALLALGVVLAVWCAVVLVEAQFTKAMPLPPITVTQSLPGDANSDRRSMPGPAPKPGTWLARLEAPTVQMTTTVLEGSDDATLRRGAGQDRGFARGRHPSCG